MPYQWREEWLQAAVAELRPLFAAKEQDVPIVRVSVGFPATAPRKVLGECWTEPSDGIQQIYINPMRADPVDILATLVHELCHAVLPSQTKHNKTFARLAYGMGLEGKPTATMAGEELRIRLNEVAAKLGPLPHTALELSAKKKQTTRLLKAVCPACGYTVRVTKKWVDIALPTCTPCAVGMLVAVNEEAGEAEGD